MDDRSTSDLATGAVRRASLIERIEALEWSRADDIEERGAAAEALIPVADAAGAADIAWRARLVVADMASRTNDAATSTRQVAEVIRWAAANGVTFLHSRAEMVLSSLLSSLGDLPAALEHAVAAAELLEQDAPARVRGNTLLRLADVLAMTGSVDEARRRYRQAAALFESVDDFERILNVLNNVTVLEYECGNIRQANIAADRLMLAATSSEAGLCSDYADTVARARLLAGELGPAEYTARLALQLLELHQDPSLHTLAEHQLTLAEVLVARGALEEAQENVESCLAICVERNLHTLRVAALGVLAELLAARGDFEAAYHAHRTFHAESIAQRSRDQEAAAHARQTLLETAEARREAEQFWRQARTDPLTELFNRRYVDELLPGLLISPAEHVAVAAIVDVDHFKRINDRYTHAIGDEVLRRLARTLADFVTSVDVTNGEQHGFAARLGGEEFLLAWHATNAQTAIADTERLKRAVEQMTWHDIAVDLCVTVSIGVAVVIEGDTQFSVLSRADQHLYGAKASGRNRVVSDLIDA